MADFGPRRALVVCNEKEEIIIGDIRVMTWQTFLAELWAGEIIA